MNANYKVGELIYDANIYDGMNTFLSDLQFYKKWLPTNKIARILELCCGTGRLTLPIEDGVLLKDSENFTIKRKLRDSAIIKF